MIQKRTNGKITWIDVIAPTVDDTTILATEYGINALVCSDILRPSLRPKVDLYRNYIYLILHFPSFRSSRAISGVREVDFVIGKDFIVTARYEPVEQLDAFAKKFEVDSVVTKNQNQNHEHAGFVFYDLINFVYGSLLTNIEALQNGLTDIERKIYAGKERAMVIEISNMSRSLLDFKHAMMHHHEVLLSFESAGKSLFGHDFSHYLFAIAGEYAKIESALKSELESLAELRETNNSLLSTKTNDIMKMLTVVSVIVLPLSVLTALFQIDSYSRPIIGIPNDFYILGGGLVSIGLISYIFFKYWKKWI